jgi:hypothetical protein
VAEAVLEAAGKRGDFSVPTAEPRPQQRDTEAEEDLQDWLDNIRPEDFADPQ